MDSKTHERECDSAAGFYFNLKPNYLFRLCFVAVAHLKRIPSKWSSIIGEKVLN